MKQAKWIWHYGDFEIYHAMRVNGRREQYGLLCHPAMWRVDAPHTQIRLYKRAVLDKPETLTVTLNGDGMITDRADDGEHRYNPGEVIPLAPGNHFIQINMQKYGGLPAAYCEGETFASDETWRSAAFGEGDDPPAGCRDDHGSRDVSPEVFCFSYEPIAPVSVEKIGDGTLYDFGRETYATVTFTKIVGNGEKIRMNYGESREEALDPSDLVPLRDTIDTAKESVSFRARAFRYLYVTDTRNVSFELHCLYEYLPLSLRGAFRCGEERLNRIWDVCAYTLHLNTREGYLDGIKRDGWLWSGDAYQSYFVNYYLFFDGDSVRRTILGLRGNDPMWQHINTIPDYSFFWVCSIYDYWFHTGDLEFVRLVYPKMKSLFAFTEAGCDERGFYQKRQGDWIFIDWADTAKSGTVCALQMLLAHAYDAMAKCADALGEDGTPYRGKASALIEKINALFWRDELGAFVDCIDRDDRVDVVTRHANIFALLYGLTTPEREKAIIENVIENEKIPPITTPYFEFFELDAMCSHVGNGYMMEKLRSYWGGMIDLGATTIWEQFDPEETGREHLAMYGMPYGRSLCHAWGASPIYLIGRYVLGVSPTSVAYRTFEVAPDLSALSSFSGRVPLPDGSVTVEWENGKLTVETDCDGGTLVLAGERIPLEKGRKMRKKA